MLNCIMATIGSNSGINAAKTPSSFMRRNPRSGLPCFSRMSIKIRIASSDLRIDPSIKCRFADKSRMAFGWIKRPVRIASSKTRSRFILSCKNASGSAMASRFCNTEKPGFNFGFRRNTRSKTGSFFTCAASRAVRKMRVNSPTFVAWRK